MMRILFVFLPAILLIVGALLGVCRLWRGLIFFGVWICGIYIAVILAALQIIDPLPTLVICLLLAPLSFWFATLFSFATSRPVTPRPIDEAVKVYQSLDPATQKKVQDVARMGAKVVARAAARYLDERGHSKAAKSLDEARRLF